MSDQKVLKERAGLIADKIKELDRPQIHSIDYAFLLSGYINDLEKIKTQLFSLPLEY